MGRSIQAAAAVRPRHEANGVTVEGPDEDLFTLAVAAIERLPPSEKAHGALHLVGDFTEGVDWAFGEALGTEGLEVHRHGAGVAGLFQALVAASAVSPEAPSQLVVAADVSDGPPDRDGPRGAGATAFRLADGPGAETVGHAARSHPSTRRPDAAAWVATAHRSLGRPEPAMIGALQVVAEAPAPVLLAEWAKSAPSSVHRVLPWVAPGVGSVPSTVGAFALFDLLGRSPAPTLACLAAIRPDRTEYLGVRTGPVVWSGDWESPGGPLAPARSTPGKAPGPSLPADAVSEGAYVPWARYVENLPSRWRFQAEACAQCGFAAFPGRGTCPSCGAKDGLRPLDLPRNDLAVEAVTTISPGAQPTEFDWQVECSGPYSVVIVRLSPTVRATLQVADAPGASLHVGDRVDTELRRLYLTEGRWRYGRKAVPRTASTG